MNMIKKLKKCFISCFCILNVADQSLIAKLISMLSLLTSKLKLTSLTMNFKFYISLINISFERMRFLFSLHMIDLTHFLNLIKLFNLSLSLSLSWHLHFILSYLAFLTMIMKMLLKSLVLVQSWLLEHFINSWWTFWDTSIIWHTKKTEM